MRTLIFSILATFFAGQINAQKLIWTSQTGGDNNNGAIIEYDLTNNQTSILGSLGGNFMKGYNLFIDDGLSEDTWNTNGMIMGSDGNLYGVNSTINSNPVYNNSGGIYKLNTTTNKLTLLHSFSIYGLHNPVLGLIEASPGVFYGLTRSGGDFEYGGVWKYDLNSSAFSEVASFDDLASNGIGRYPISPLIVGPNGDLFGVIKTTGSFGSGFNDGHLYKVDITNDNASYVTSLDAAGWAISGPIDQIAYNSSLNKIFGTKEEFDGTNTGAGIYSYNFNNQTVTNEILIDNSQTAVLGEYGHGISHQANDGYHYLICRSGGANNKGTLLKYSPSGNTVVKVHDFNYTPNGTGIKISGTKILGTYLSTNSTQPLVWSYDVSSTIFSDIIYGTDDDTQGYFISPSFGVNNNELYGITRNGGSSDAGSIFKYNLGTGLKSIIQNNQSTEGRGLIGEIAITNDTNAYAYISSGGEETIPNEFSEQGGLAKINLATGSVLISNTLSDYVEYQRSHSHKYNKPLISQSGKLFTSSYSVSSVISQVNYSEINMSTGSHSILHTENSHVFNFSGIENATDQIIFAAGDSYYQYNETTQVTTSLFSNVNTDTEGNFVNNLIKASNGKIYGTTISTDNSDPLKKCIIYSVDQSFGSHTVEKTFDAPVKQLNNGLTEVNGKLYGSTIEGGANNNGYLFSLDIATSTFTIEYSFDATTDGEIFLGEWTEYGGSLYAVSYSGGAAGYGTLVEFEISTGTFTVLENLDINNGRAFRSTPIFWDNNVLGINETMIETSNFIYPNPARTKIYVDLKNINKIEIYTISGQLKGRVKNNNSVNIENLISGIYIIKVYNDSGIFSSKLIKE